MSYQDADDIIDRDPCRHCPDDFGCAFKAEPLCAEEWDDQDEDPDNDPTLRLLPDQIAAWAATA